MASSSMKSEINTNEICCFCDLKAPLRISTTPWSKGKKFYGCANYKYKGKKKPCTFFAWANMEEEDGSKSLEEKNVDVDEGLRARIELLLHENKEIKEENKVIRKENSELKGRSEALFWKLMFFISWGIYFVMKYVV